MTKVILHIDQLVLNGLQRSDAAAITASLQSELQGRLRDPAARAALTKQGNIGTCAVGPVKLRQNASSRAIGTALARRIAGGGR